MGYHQTCHHATRCVLVLIRGIRPLQSIYRQLDDFAQGKQCQ
jgi:hypothetical protein